MYFFRKWEVRVTSFVDKTTGTIYRPEEYLAVKKLIKEGHEIVSRFYFKYEMIEHESSKLLWLKENKYKTKRNGNVYSYNSVTYR